MKFYDINYNKPKGGDIILAKLKPNPFWNDSIDYYVFRALVEDDEYIFEEACGEQYWTVGLDEIIGWMPLKKLDEVEILSKETLVIPTADKPVKVAYEGEPILDEKSYLKVFSNLMNNIGRLNGTIPEEAKNNPYATED